jgi:hypothetical protein
LAGRSPTRAATRPRDDDDKAFGKGEAMNDQSQRPAKERLPNDTALGVVMVVLALALMLHLVIGSIS